MRKILAILLLAVVMPAATLLGQSQTVTQQCKLSVPFDKISVSDGITLNLHNAAEQSATITCKQVNPRCVETLVEGSTLVIRIKPGYKISKSSTVVAEVSVPQLTAIVASGGSKINFDGTFATKAPFSVTTSGGVFLSGGIDCGNLKIVCSGGCNINIKGKCASLDAVASGGCRINCGGLTAESVNAVFSGGASGVFTTTGSHNMQASGGGGYIVKNAAGKVVARK